MVEPLPFLTTDGRDPVAKHGSAADPRTLFSGRPHYDRLRAAGVRSHVFRPADTVTGVYGRLTARAADTVFPYDTVAQAAVDLRHALEATTGPTYHYVYVPHVDAAAHAEGTDSDRYRATLESVTGSLHRELTRLDDATAAETLVLVTADHGHLNTVPEENVDLRADRFDPLWEGLKRDDAGDPVAPFGSGRNLHLRVRPDHVASVQEAVESELDALVFTRTQALDRGLFGDRPPGETFERRCGDLVVVHRDRTVWHDADALSYVGMHGGLTPAEMLVPFGAVRADAFSTGFRRTETV